jgi:hypothetical protein
MRFAWVSFSLISLLVALAIWHASPETIVGLVGALGRGPRLAQLLLYLHHHAFVAIVPSVLLAPLGIGVTRTLAESKWVARYVAATWTVLLTTLRRSDRTKKTRLVAVLAVLTPLAIFTKWFGVIHGTFTYDDLDILAVIRTAPLLPSLLLLHGDAAIPLFRIFFAGMYATFGVQELYWNLYFLLLMLMVNAAAVVLLVRLGTNLVVAALFYVTVMSADVWTYVALGYYSMSIYQQIGLLGLLGVLAVIKGQDENSAYYLWVALAFSALAPFIHPSGAYVPIAVGGFAFVRELGHSDSGWSPLRMFRADYRFFTLGLLLVVAVFAVYLIIAVRSNDGAFLSMAHNPLSPATVTYSIYLLLSQGLALELLKPFVVVLAGDTNPELQGALALPAIGPCARCARSFCAIFRRVGRGRRPGHLRLQRRRSHDGEGTDRGQRLLGGSGWKSKGGGIERLAVGFSSSARSRMRREEGSAVLLFVLPNLPIARTIGSGVRFRR